MVTDLSIIKDINPLFEYSIVVYGAGAFGMSVCAELKTVGIRIEAFCDTYPKTEKIGEIPVFSQEQLKCFCEKEKTLIILASEYFDEIYTDLIKKQIEGEGIITALAVRYAIVLNINSKYIISKYQKICLVKMEIWKQLLLQREEADRTLAHYLQLLEAEKEYKILVYQPGKVGSTTIQKSLEQRGILCEHIHILNNRISMNNRKYKILLDGLKNRKIKIITGIREPIARAISSFIHPFLTYKAFLWNGLTNDLLDSCIKYLKEFCCNDNKLKERIPVFNENEYTSCVDQMGNEFAWFDKEIKEVLGIDIFEYPFNRGKGYTIIEKGNVQIFIYKLEKLNTLEKELGNFVGVTNFQLKYFNDGQQKMTKYLYSQLNNTIKIPMECLNYYYHNNERMQHFYTEQEIKDFIKKWQHK